MLTLNRPIARNVRAPADAVVLETRVVCGAGGGPDKTIINSPRYLRSEGYKTICAYMHPPADQGFAELRRKADAAEVSLVSVPDRGPWDWRVVTQLIKLCRRERVDIWHGHDYKSNVLGLLVRRFWPMKLVTTVHGWVRHTRRTPVYYKVDQLCLPRYQAVICVSRDLFDQCRTIGVSADRCHLVENGITVREFTRKTPIELAKQRWHVPAGRIAIGAVGRLSAEKGFDLLIRAAQRMVQRGLPVQLLIAGAGDDEPHLRQLIHSLGLADQVRLLGHVSEPKSLFEAFDIFALSSHREGLPNVLLEAMAMEVPVVATVINGIPDVIEGGVSGVLVKPNSVESLADGLIQLAQDPSLRIRIAAAGRRTVAERFDFGQRMGKIKNIYDELLGRC